jgi:BON domain
MSETLYGSGVPIWSAVPSQGFAWLQPPIPVANQLTGPTIGFGPTMPGQSPALQGQAPFTMPGAYSSPFMAPDMSPNSAAALLTAVALRRGQPLGPTNDQEIEDFFYDALEVFPGAVEVEVRSESGRITLTGRVQHKKLKRDLGEIAWATPSVADVQNNLTITARRRPRAAAARDQEPASPARKPA